MAKKKATFHVGVVVTLYNKKGEVLMAKRAPFKSHAANAWENISGAVEHGEQPEEALKREVAEELGENVRFEIEGVYNTFQAKLENGRDLVGISFLCRFLGGEVELNEEHTEYRWVKLDAAIKLTKTKGLKEEFKYLKYRYPKIFDNVSFLLNG